MIIHVILHTNSVLKCLSTLCANEVFCCSVPYQVPFHKFLCSCVLAFWTFESNLFWLSDDPMYLQHVFPHVSSSEESLTTSIHILAGNLDVLPVLLHVLFKRFRRTQVFSTAFAVKEQILLTDAIFNFNDTFINIFY